MTLDEKIERTSGRFVVVATDRGQVLDSDNRFDRALEQAEVEAADHARIVIVDKWLEEGASGIVWRSYPESVQQAESAGVQWAERSADSSGTPTGVWLPHPSDALLLVDSEDPQERQRLALVINDAAARRWAEIVAMPRAERLRGFLERTRGDAHGHVVFDVAERRHKPDRWLPVGTVKAADGTDANQAARRTWPNNTLLVTRRGGPGPSRHDAPTAGARKRPTSNR